MKSVLMMIVPVVVTVAILVAVWQLKLLPVSASAAPSLTPVPTATVSYTLPERVVNLADSPEYRYLKIQVTLEFADPSHRAGELKGDAVKQREDDFAKEIEPQSAAIQDFLITTLTRKSAAELLSPTGKDALRQQLLTGLQQRLPDHTLRNVYFVQFVIQ